MPKAPTITFTFRFDHLVELEMSKVKALRTFGRVDIPEQIQWAYKLTVMGEVLFEGNDLLIATDTCSTSAEAAVIALSGLVEEKNFESLNRRQKLWFAHGAEHYKGLLYRDRTIADNDEDVVSTDEEGNEYVAASSFVRYQV